MTHRRSETSRGNIPTRTEDQKVHQRDIWLFGFGGEDTKNGRVDVVLGDASYVDEFLEGVLVGDVTKADSQPQARPIEASRSILLSVPCNDVEWCVFLIASMQLPSDPVIAHQVRIIYTDEPRSLINNWNKSRNQPMDQGQTSTASNLLLQGF